MKRQILHGSGIQGMRVDLSVCDMFAANQVADELKEVLDNHKKIEEYKVTSFSKREEAFPKGEPKRIELSEKTLQNLHKLMLKLSYESKSTLFDTEDEKEVTSDKTLIQDDPYAYQTDCVYDVILLNVGPSKLLTVKTIFENTELRSAEAKRIVDKAELHPVTIITYQAAADAKKLVDLLKEAGAVAEIMPHLIYK